MLLPNHQNRSSQNFYFLIKKKDSPTIVKKRYLDLPSMNKIFGVYDINDNLLNKKEETELCAKLENCISEYDVINVVDYGHGLITPKIVNLLQDFQD